MYQFKESFIRIIRIRIRKKIRYTNPKMDQSVNLLSERVEAIQTLRHHLVQWLTIDKISILLIYRCVTHKKNQSYY